MKSRRLVVGIAVCLLAMASVGQAKTMKTVQVDCKKGDSINAALQEKAEELIVEISGMCHEDVRVERSYVTLRGTDPETDGIVGLTPDTPEVPGKPVVSINQANNVGLENLKITGGRHGILAAHGDPTEIVNCRVVDVVRFGITSWMGSHVFCTGCTVEGALIAAYSGRGDLHLDDSTLSGRYGALSWRGYLELNNTAVEAPGYALYVGSFGETIQSGGSLTGAFAAVTKSVISLDGVSQFTGDWAWENYIGQDSTLLVQASTLSGPTYFEDFSDGTIRDESTLGELGCLSGSDVYCDGTETKASSSCGLCP